MRPAFAFGSVLLAVASALADFSCLDAKRTASADISRASESTYQKAPILEDSEPDWLNGRLRMEESCRECSVPQRERKMLEERLKKRERQESGGKR